MSKKTHLTAKVNYTLFALHYNSRSCKLKWNRCELQKNSNSKICKSPTALAECIFTWSVNEFNNKPKYDREMPTDAHGNVHTSAWELLVGHKKKDTNQRWNSCTCPAEPSQIVSVAIICYNFCWKNAKHWRLAISIPSFYGSPGGEEDEGSEGNRRQALVAAQVQRRHKQFNWNLARI